MDHWRSIHHVAWARAFFRILLSAFVGFAAGMDALAFGSEHEFIVTPHGIYIGSGLRKKRALNSNLRLDLPGYNLPCDHV